MPTASNTQGQTVATSAAVPRKILSTSEIYGDTRGSKKSNVSRSVWYTPMLRLFHQILNSFCFTRRVRMNELEQEAEVKKAEIRIQFEVNTLLFESERTLNTHRKQYKRDETRKDNEFKREQTMHDQDLIMLQRLKQEQLVQLSALLIREMVRRVDAGIPIEEVIANNPLLRDVFAMMQYGNAALPTDGAREQLNGSTEVKEANSELLKATPPDKKNAPQVPIPESDSAEFSEIDGEVVDDEEDEE